MGPVCPVCSFFGSFEPYSTSCMTASSSTPFSMSAKTSGLHCRVVGPVIVLAWSRFADYKRSRRGVGLVYLRSTSSVDRLCIWLGLGLQGKLTWNLTLDCCARLSFPDDPFGHLHHEESSSNTSQGNRGEEAGGCAAISASCSRVFHAWRPFAWKTAAGFGTVAAALFGAVGSAVEPEDTVWKVCVGFVTLLLFGAAISVAVGTHDQLCTNLEEQPQSQQGY